MRSNTHISSLLEVTGHKENRLTTGLCQSQQSISLAYIGFTVLYNVPVIFGGHAYVFKNIIQQGIT